MRSSMLESQIGKINDEPSGEEEEKLDLEQIKIEEAKQ